MKRISASLLVSLLVLSACGQENREMNTLLWKISGKGIDKPSYLFGTIHMICKEDAGLSENLRNAIRDADRIYLEMDMDNLIEMMGAMTRIKMKGDTTLADLLTPEEYTRVKTFFANRSSMLPFSVIETYKPLLASALIMESGIGCDQQVAMEQVIMEEAKRNGKRIEGLETIAYQMCIFDSIPYHIQAKELVQSIDIGDSATAADAEYKELIDAYRTQDLEKLGRLITKSGSSMMQYQDILLTNRNRNWVSKLETLVKDRALLIAVGAGHLPGPNGVIQLLRNAGYKVTPVPNKRADREI